MSENLVTVARYFNLPLAYLMQSRLREAGLHTFMPDEHTALAYEGGIFGLGRSGIRLQVPEQDVEEALALLEADEREAVDESVYIPSDDDEEMLEAEADIAERKFFRVVKYIAIGILLYVLVTRIGPAVLSSIFR